jgi:hypothetical protein
MSLRDAFLNQAQSCVALGSPFMGRLLTCLAEDWPTDSALAKAFDGFVGDIGPKGHSLPLRLAGGLHALVLAARDPNLAAVYPPNAPSDDRLRRHVLEGLRHNEAFLLDWIKSAPQTNEVRRSAALIPGARVAAARFPLPMILSELGSSGGLNMMWDHFALVIGDQIIGPEHPTLTLMPEWTGPMPPSISPVLAERTGVDLNPLDPRKPADLLRLTAYLWADQPDRLALTRDAAAVMDAPIIRADAIDWLEMRLATVYPGHLHLIQHTIAWQYFPQAAQARGQAMIEAAGQRATKDTPLAWLALENDGDVTGQIGAALTLRLWPGDIRLALGRADFHGRWVQWSGLT